MDADDFRTNLDAALRDGSFRLVLPQAPQELMKLVGYLEVVTQGPNAPVISNQLLDALFDAYVEAASTIGRIAI